ncbi:MAG: DUF2490 domain-containing protein [Gammaproteobacteria bacterium]|nr:DUF2490 domain-containing protein [Gammaproteobacteria bacterium]MDH4253575.1 DUF2490 domain-containing protein [Gammaproteobacteria bacterium]MDH5310160.1 DUF2490 domain-containing protein [Gammaproteobacteria bacterium]
MSRWSILLIVALVSHGVSPAATAADNAGGGWAILSTADHFKSDGAQSRWRYAFDTQYRYFDRADGLTTVLLRPSIGYDLRPGLALFAGYAYFESELADGTSRHENRVFQQLSWTALRRERATLSFRTRLAQRFIEGGDDVGIWLRQMVRLDVPMDADRRMQLVMSVEPFFNLNDTDWGAESGFLQNRSFLGVSFGAMPKLRIETGYMNLYVRRRSAEDLANHIFVVNFRVDL